MLVPSANIWDTRIQTVGAVVTAAAGDRREAYFLATACPVGLSPPLLSISPNPEYPICAVLEEAGRFGIHFLAEHQEALMRRCIALDRALADKVGALDTPVETSGQGIPMLLDCIVSLECRVVRSWDSGDHRTIIGEVMARHARSEGWAPLRYFRVPGPINQLFRTIMIRTRLYDGLWMIRQLIARPPGISEGTKKHLSEGTTR